LFASFKVLPDTNHVLSVWISCSGAGSINGSYTLIN